MQDSDQLIRTKLHLPFVRPGLIARPRLQEQIARGLRGPLTLITAPAGFGKTTLVASCVASSGMPVAWLSVDKNDNRAGRFVSYLVAALKAADDAIGTEALHLLAASPQASPEAVLTSLVNDLDSAGRDMALVLDDYQFISSQAVHEAVTFLLEHCPRTLHVLIATRSDPPLPLARLRARAQTVELRAADLRFTSPEVAEFLNGVMELHLDATVVAVLEERTEGWIAGLQMAALSVRDRSDVRGFIEGFSGTHRYILDYLLEEVLVVQPPQVQQFLLCTSILERLSAPLCDALLTDPEISALLGRSAESSVASSTSQTMLDLLERANLFLVPLDDERAWYRYHHLFADLLRARLDQLYPGLSRRLHARAGAWLEQAGMTVEAVNHSLWAGDYDRAARLVEENTTRLLAQGELNALMAWIEMLPADLRLRRPWLCVHQAYALLFAGRTVEVGPLLLQAEAALEAEADRIRVRALKGALATVRAFSATILVQDAEALSQARQARSLLMPEDLFNQSLVAWAVGYTMHRQGRLVEARSAFEEQIRLSRTMQNSATLMIGVTALARVLADQGEFQEVRSLLQSALDDARQKETQNRGFIARVEAHLAAVLCELNELETAHRLLSDALGQARFWLNPNHLASINAYLARVLLGQGDLEGARAAIAEADRIRRTASLSEWLRRGLEVDIVRTWLALQCAGLGFSTDDPLVEASRLTLASWRSELARHPGGGDAPISQFVELPMLTLARVSLVSGRAEEALALLEPVTHTARTAGHVDMGVQALVLTAMARHAKRAAGAGAALAALGEALTLAAPGGYIRVFLNEGQPMRLLLEQWLAQADSGPLRDYALRLLSHFEAEVRAAAALKKSPPAGGLIEPLSQRELEVLQLMSLGRTNQEIARQLIVAPGTVKAHAASIYRKLDAGNRTEAVARARQLGIIP